MRFTILAALIAIASPAVAQEPSATVALGSGQKVPVEQVDATLESLARESHVNGFSVAIVNENAIVYERAFGMSNVETQTPVTTETLFEFASMSKPAFGALVVDLASEGVIDLDRPLAEYYPHPDLADDPRAAKITARHVLTHQTGLPNWRSDNPNGTLDFAFEPGQGRRYSGEAFEYLADVVMHILKVDDRGLDRVFQERIARPAGATDTFFVQSEDRIARKPVGYSKGEPFSGDIDYANDGFGAAYSIHSTAPDYAKLLIGLMSGSSLTEAERADFLSGQGVNIAADDPERAFGLTDHALGYPIYELPVGRVYAHGGNNEGFSGTSAMIPAKGWGFVLVSNENQAHDFILKTSVVLLGLNMPTPQ